MASVISVTHLSCVGARMKMKKNLMQLESSRYALFVPSVLVC